MKNKIISLLLLLSLTFSFTVYAGDISENNKRELLRYILINASNNAKHEIDSEELFLDTLMKFAGDSDEDYEQILKYFTQSIDEYGDYMSPEESFEMEADLTGQSGGIGSGVEMRNGKIYVVNVIPGSPSEKAGVQVGHAIVKANGVDLSGMSLNEALTYIRGEAGTEVVITFEDSFGTLYDILLVRDIIEVSSVNYSVVIDSPHIGYIEITNFSMTTGEELRKAITTLTEEGVTELILDLRDNGGGVLEGALQVAGIFLKEGQKILTVEPRDVKSKEVYKASGKMFDGEVVILVNEYTASASEVVVGALKDHKRATIIGETTFGKGTVQHLFPLPIYGGYFKFTTAQYLTPNDISINKKGISPHLTVNNENYKLTVDDIPAFSFLRVMRQGDTGEDVKNIKESLRMLNYSVDETDTFDFDTFNAIKTFQKKADLYPYGVCDFTTQQHLKQALLNTVFYEDTQLEKAIEYLNE